MLQHPELIFWKKCPTCGWSVFDSESHAKSPKASKMATYKMQSGSISQFDDMSKELDSTTSSHKE